MTASPTSRGKRPGLLASLHAGAGATSSPRSPLVPEGSRRRPRAVMREGCPSPANHSKRPALSGFSSSPSLSSSSSSASSAASDQWSPSEDESLRVAVLSHGEGNLQLVSRVLGNRSAESCGQRWALIKDVQVKGAWCEGEDALVKVLVVQFGAKRWTQLAALVPGRTGKQCRERWLNHLAPDIKKSPWDDEEDRVLLEAQADMGNQWSRIANMLEGRTENACKNRWNSLITRSGGSRSAASRAAAARAARQNLSKASSSSSSSAASASSAYSYSRPRPTPTPRAPPSVRSNPFAPAGIERKTFERLIAPPSGFDALDLSERGVPMDDEPGLLSLSNDRSFWAAEGWALS